MTRKILIKIGGRAFDQQSCYQELAEAFKRLHHMRFIIVHGGGNAISQALKEAKQEPAFIDGYRITTEQDIKIVERVLSKEVNKSICSHLEKYGITCRPLSGKSKNLLHVEPYFRNGRCLGRVGKIKNINPAVVLRVLEENQVPVLSPVSADQNGLTYNVNADSAAAALAYATTCSDLIYFTDVQGLMIDGRVQSALAAAEIKSLIDKGKIHGGMVAKMDSAFAALENGVNRVHITKWQGAGALEEMLDQSKTTGTVIHL